MDGIDAVAVLQDAVRRRLYDYVASQDHEVGRNEAAEAVGMQRSLAAFHLDKLAEAGLLEVVFRRLSGKSGPGAGRPAKLYRRSGAEYVVSVPQRDYVTVAEVLAEVVESARLDAEVEDAARRRGRTEAAAGDVAERLAARGYEPVVGEEGELRLWNCPFHRLAEDFPPIVCGMNLALLEGLLEGSGYHARMEARPGWCCVVVSKNNES